MGGRQGKGLPHNKVSLLWINHISEGIKMTATCECCGKSVPFEESLKYLVADMVVCSEECFRCVLDERMRKATTPQDDSNEE